MRCPNHLLREAVGYCKTCGQFGCADCLVFHENEYYCKRDFKPFQEVLERQRKKEQHRTRPERQRLAIHTKKGEVFFGVCFAMNLEHETFKLDLVDDGGTPIGKTQPFAFKDIKGVFYVKSFDGEFDRNHIWTEHKPEGGGLIVEFYDGEIMKGHTYQTYHNEAARFHFIIDDPESNNISVLVERTAVKAVYTPEEFHESKKREIKDYIKAHSDSGRDPEELIGDYYLSKKDPHRAVGHYHKALENGGESPSLLKKIVVSEYNTAMQYIRDKHLQHALHHLEKARRVDEDNEQVLQRIAQIRQRLHLDRHSERARAE